MATMRMPRLVYGTAWKQERTHDLVYQAVHSGFRGIDTACQPKHYQQALVGTALQQLFRNGVVERKDLWIQTKFTSLDGQDLKKPMPYDPNAPLATQVQQSLETSLAELGVSYLDALVLHSPMRTRQETLEVWRQFGTFVASGQVRYLGLSNCYDGTLLEWCYENFTIKPFILQNHFHAQTDYSLQLLDFLGSLDDAAVTHFQSFWTLTANPHLIASPPVASLAKMLRLTNEQVFFRFLLRCSRFGQVEFNPLSGTANEKHMADDVAVANLGLEALAQPWTDEEEQLSRALWG